MKDEPKKDGNEKVISARLSDPALKRAVANEAELRGHTTSQAVEEIIKLGLPKYLKRFPRKFEPVNSEAA